MSKFRLTFNVSEALAAIGAAGLAINGNYAAAGIVLMFNFASMLSDIRDALRASKEQPDA